MAACDNAVLFAGQQVGSGSPKITGFLTIVSADTGGKIADLPLDAPPVYQGLAVANERVYATLQNGSAVCLAKPE